MAEELQLTEKANKEQRYQELLPQIQAVISRESNLIANLANIAAILSEGLGHFWTGFYLRDDDELILGPFQGPLACTRIPITPTPRGVCGVCASTNETQLVQDVNNFPGHIACSTSSKSEIVVPLVVNNVTELVLDIDSDQLNMFDGTDQTYLEKVIELIRVRNFS